MFTDVLAVVMSIGFLVFLECVLSIDNAVVLAVLVKHLPPDQRKRALTYGMVGAFTFRILGLLALTWILQYTWLKALGGGYLLWLTYKHFFAAKAESGVKEVAAMSFWATIVAVELTDIAFAMDSLFAAAGLSQNIWIVALGGVLGIIAMRFAAQGVSKILDKVPGLEDTAYQLVGLIGAKLCLEAAHVQGVDFHATDSAWFWGFWAVMASVIGYGVYNARKQYAASQSAAA